MPFLEKHGEAELMMESVRKTEDNEEIVSAGAHNATITPRVWQPLRLLLCLEESREESITWGRSNPRDLLRLATGEIVILECRRYPAR
jgi:hypothetical protein